MENTSLVFAFIGGFIICFVILYFYFKKTSISIEEFSKINNQKFQLETNLDSEKKIAQSLIAQNNNIEESNKESVIKINAQTKIIGSLETELVNSRKKNEEYDSLKTKFDSLFQEHTIVSTEADNSKIQVSQLKDDNKTLTKINEENQTEILQISKELFTFKAINDALQEKVNTIKKEIDDARDHFKTAFSIEANKVLEEKSTTFKTLNKTELDNILNPLKIDIKDFGKQIEDTRKEEIADITNLKTEITNLTSLNNKLSEDANKLVSALKGDNKMQGNWGEDRLKMIIENEGLQKHIDYSSQQLFKNDEYDNNKQPDYIIKLPDNKSLIIDSKVSLKAYVDFFNSTNPEEKSIFLKQHISSVKNHVESLFDKQYQTINGITTTDYVMMFMPIENAFTLLLNENPELFNYAINKKVIILTPSTLVATLKVIKLLWQKEQRVDNIEKVFKQCGALYDKFVGFAEDMLKIKNKIKDAAEAYDDAINKLKEGKKRGETIIGRIESIRKLEAPTKNKMPEAFLAEIELLEDDENIIKQLPDSAD